ncbi:MAG TPA: GlsB/YeaQ/YmgE family stress response membrane protein [Planctomycetota bacterium]|nr:GlsB/YeaQ/YmgE family stress response membrane protein [Planctomycetota bacterium]
MENILALLIVGAIAGWLSSLIMKSKGLSLGGYLVLGILGAIVGGFLFSLLQLHASGLIGSIVAATVGSMVLIWAVKAIWKKA